MKRRAVFLDRDGTVVEAVLRPDTEKPVTAPFVFSELVFIPGAREIIESLKKRGFLVIMVTNQPDVRHGYMLEFEWNRIHEAVLVQLPFDDFSICRHLASDNCPRKKPLPGMLFDLADKWNIDLKTSWMVGDTSSDTLAGSRAGCRTVLIDRDYNLGVGAHEHVKHLNDILDVIF